MEKTATRPIILLIDSEPRKRKHGSFHNDIDLHRVQTPDQAEAVLRQLASEGKTADLVAIGLGAANRSLCEGLSRKLSGSPVPVHQITDGMLRQDLSKWAEDIIHKNRSAQEQALNILLLSDTLSASWVKRAIRQMDPLGYKPTVRHNDADWREEHQALSHGLYPLQDPCVVICATDNDPSLSRLQPFADKGIGLIGHINDEATTQLPEKIGSTPLLRYTSGLQRSSDAMKLLLRDARGEAVNSLRQANPSNHLLAVPLTKSNGPAPEAVMIMPKADDPSMSPIIQQITGAGYSLRHFTDADRFLRYTGLAQSPKGNPNRIPSVLITIGTPPENLIRALKPFDAAILGTSEGNLKALGSMSDTISAANDKQIENSAALLQSIRERQKAESASQSQGRG